MADGGPVKNTQKMSPAGGRAQQPVTHPLAEKTVAVVLAGGRGQRLGRLTRNVCKPALPFGAACRNIDFSLSNCINSGIRKVGIATQHQPAALAGHVRDVWRDLPKGEGGFVSLWPAEESAPVTGYCGTADAVFRNLDRIDRLGNGLVLVLAGDHVYRMDYRPMLEFHRERQADVTVACVEVPAEDASHFGVVSADPARRINRFVEKPQRRDDLPAGERVLASMGIYVFGTSFLAKTLRKDSFSTRSRHDFGADILPGLLGDARLLAYPFVGADRSTPGYWRDVGTPAAYWRAHLELLDDDPALRLDDPEWPLPAAWNAVMNERPFRCADGRFVSQRSLVATGCRVDGGLNRSVLFPGVEVSAGSVVDSSVLLPGSRIGRNCVLTGAIVDSGCRVPDGTVIDGRSPAGRAGAAGPPLIVTSEDFAPALIEAIA